jgi:hypothetical protein
MTFKETLLSTIEDNRLEMLMPSREYSEEERVYMRGYNQALEDVIGDFDAEICEINRSKYTYSLN